MQYVNTHTSPEPLKKKKTNKQTIKAAEWMKKSRNKSLRGKTIQHKKKTNEKKTNNIKEKNILNHKVQV